GGRVQDTERPLPEAEGGDEENRGASEASVKGDDVAMKAIAEKLAALSHQHPVGSVKKALAAMRKQQAKDESHFKYLLKVLLRSTNAKKG
ncbi:unnamed protein product, partial [Ectocarpus sp. 12 AP-2014]